MLIVKSIVKLRCFSCFFTRIEKAWKAWKKHAVFHDIFTMLFHAFIMLFLCFWYQGSKFWNWVFLTSNIRKIKSENKFFYEQFKAIITAWLLSSFEIQNNCTGQEIKRTHLHYTPKVYQILHLGYMFQTSQNFK